MSLASFATSKRSSCDRCRKQKLRCPEKEGPGQSCARCHRAGAPCVMSYTRPRGRSQKDTILQDNEDARKSPPEALTTPSNLVLTGSDHSTDNTTAQLWPFIDDYSPFSSLPSSYEPGQAQTQEDASSTTHYSPLYCGLEIDILSEMPHLSQNAFPKADTEFTPQDKDASDMYDCSNSTLKPVHQLGSEMRLSWLNLNLCQQLQTQILPPASITKAAVENPMSNTPSSLRDILQSTESYIQVLQSLVECSSNSGSTGPLPSDRLASSHLLTFPCMLNLILCFSHIVDLLNAFLDNLDKELDAHNLSSPANEFQILPELKLAGLPIHEGNLQIKILVLVISHQFETMERLLGLPAELRVSLQTEIGPRGLLPPQWIATLLNSKSELAGLNDNWMYDHVQTIQLLRRNISRLQTMI